jgi:DNA repair protein RecN (Recombination protein N)
MLEELHVSGLGVFEEASLEFEPGLNVLTGETGAGKTVLANALGLVLGARATADLIRPGRDGLSVEARFAVSTPPPPELSEWTDDGELVLERRVRADGKGTARAGGHLTQVSALAGVGRWLVEIHGQRQTERLLEPAAQTGFLDRYAGLAHLGRLAAYQEAHGRLVAARNRLAILDREERERERERDLLGYQIREIETAALRTGEVADLEIEEARLASAERILALAASALADLSEEGAAGDFLWRASASLRSAAELDPSASALVTRAESLAAEADDLAGEVRAYHEATALDPARLEEVRERLQAIKALGRKYGEGVDGILAYLEEATARLAGIEGAETERAALADVVEAAGREAGELASAVTAARKKAAPKLAAALTEELRDLGMQGAAVDVDLVPTPEPGSGGAESAVFRFSGGQGQAARPLAKVASGGELSRTMLACRSVLADLDDVPTLVFDEIDAGVGGRAATAVARRLADLAAARQIVVVTHLAQIAAHADRHFVITKQRGRATVRQLADEERPAELARMLSGEVTDLSLAHAQDLIDSGHPS